jgi:hypothetical protein
MNMDVEGRKLFILLIFQCSLFVILESMPRYEGAILAWKWQQLGYVAVALRRYMTHVAARPRRLWAHDRGLHWPGFFDQIFLGSFNAQEFKGRMRMDVSTFEYLCSTFASAKQRQNTNIRFEVLIQVKVAVSISRLAICNSMQNIADLYKIGLSTSQFAVFLFNVAVKSILLRKFLRWPSPTVMEKFAQEF